MTLETTTTDAKRPLFSWTLKGHYIWQATGNNYGREEAAGLGIICWEQLRSRSSRLFIGQMETTTAAKRPPSWTLKGHYFWQATGKNYGRDEAAAMKRLQWSGRIWHLLRRTTTVVAKRPLFWLNKWKQLRPRSGRLLELGNWVTLPPLFFINLFFKFLFFLHQKNTKVAISTQNHYGCKAVSTSVASLFHLKRHKRFSSILLTPGSQHQTRPDQTRPDQTKPDSVRNLRNTKYFLFANIFRRITPFKKSTTYLDLALNDKHNDTWQDVL